MALRPVWSLAVGGVVCVSGLVLSGCTGEPAVPGPSPSPSIDPPPGGGLSHPVTHPDVAYAWSALWSQSWPVDQLPASQWRPVLDQVASGPLVDQLVQRKTADFARGVRLYGQIQPHVTGIRVTGGQATVLDCQDASHAGQADASGTPKTVGIARTSVLGTLTRTESGWRVERIDYSGGRC